MECRYCFRLESQLALSNLQQFMVQASFICIFCKMSAAYEDVFRDIFGWVSFAQSYPFSCEFFIFWKSMKIHIFFLWNCRRSVPAVINTTSTGHFQSQKHATLEMPKHTTCTENEREVSSTGLNLQRVTDLPPANRPLYC